MMHGVSEGFGGHPVPEVSVSLRDALRKDVSVSWLLLLVYLTLVSTMSLPAVIFVAVIQLLSWRLWFSVVVHCVVSESLIRTLDHMTRPGVRHRPAEFALTLLCLVAAYFGFMLVVLSDDAKDDNRINAIIRATMGMLMFLVCAVLFAQRMRQSATTLFVRII